MPNSTSFSSFHSHNSHDHRDPSDGVASSASSRGMRSPPLTLTSTLVTGIKYPRTRAHSQAATSIELRFSAINLLNSDVFSLSDPFAVIYLLDTYTGDLCEIGRTETVVDDLNPRWTSSLIIPSNIDVNTELVVDIYDRDGSSASLHKHDHLGRALFAITDLASTQCSCLLETAGPDVPRKRTNLLTAFRAARGSLKVFAERVANTDIPITVSVDNRMSAGGLLELKLRAAALHNRRRGGGDCIQFWELARYNDGDGNWTVIYRSEDGTKVDRYGYTRFKSIRMTPQFLHNNIPTRPLRITFFLRQTRKPHTPIAYFDTNAQAFLQRQVIPLLRTSTTDDDKRISNVSNASAELDTANNKIKEAPPSGEVYVENISKNANITNVQILADHADTRHYFSLAQDTSGRERSVRQTPDFIKLH